MAGCSLGDGEPPSGTCTYFDIDSEVMSHAALV